MTKHKVLFLLHIRPNCVDNNEYLVKHFNPETLLIMLIVSNPFSLPKCLFKTHPSIHIFASYIANPLGCDDYSQLFIYIENVDHPK